MGYLYEGFDVREEYHKWMCSLVSGDREFNPDLSYRKLLRYLDRIQYQPFTYMDEDRVADGCNLRYIYLTENGLEHRDELKPYLYNRMGCSMLEMMIAMAYRGEDNIACDDDYGNRTGQWFWAMIASLGLGPTHDSLYDEDYINDRIFLFNQGMIPLFEIRGQETAGEPLWQQFMWYLSDIFEN